MIGVRPPDIECSIAPSNGAFPAEVYATEHSERHPLVTVKLGEQLIEVIADSLTNVQVGTPIWLSLTNSRLYVFDTITSQLVATSNAKPA